jgi:hypothetical protein
MYLLRRSRRPPTVRPSARVLLLALLTQDGSTLGDQMIWPWLKEVQNMVVHHHVLVDERRTWTGDGQGHLRLDALSHDANRINSDSDSSNAQ